MELRPSNRPISLAQLTALVDGTAQDAESAGEVAVQGVAVDSRRIHPGDLFIALPGEHAHGAEYSVQAAAAGAIAVMTDMTGAPIAGAAGLPVSVVVDPRAKVGALAAEVYGHPAEKLLTFAVTGTNGKTTTTWLLEAGLRAAGHVTGLIGTVMTQVAGRPLSSPRTTPEAAELQALLAVMVESGVTAVAIEVSSHALQLGRVDGFVFDVSGFSQFGSDHLDFHASVDEYFQAKASLFTPRHSRRAVVCIDDEGGSRIAAIASVPHQTLSTRGEDADWTVGDLQSLSTGGYSFTLIAPDGSSRSAGVRMPGRFNIANAALALAMLHTAGVPDIASEGVMICPGVPGRMEVMPTEQEFLAVVDYAHTPDALESVLRSFEPNNSVRDHGRLIVVFGCGGDRDHEKRPRMGEVAARLADIVIVTDDNPRSEDPGRIRHDVLVGAERVPEGERADILEVGDRAAAIATAVRRAQAADVLIVAGKGHETGQDIAGVSEPFDDRVVLLDSLRDRSTTRVQAVDPKENE